VWQARNFFQQGPILASLVQGLHASGFLHVSPDASTDLALCGLLNNLTLAHSLLFHHSIDPADRVRAAAVGYAARQPPEDPAQPGSFALCALGNQSLGIFAQGSAAALAPDPSTATDPDAATSASQESSAGPGAGALVRCGVDAQSGIRVAGSCEGFGNATVLAAPDWAGLERREVSCV
jgi:hypothetical protein